MQGTHPKTTFLLPLCLPLWVAHRRQCNPPWSRLLGERNVAALITELGQPANRTTGETAEDGFAMSITRPSKPTRHRIPDGERAIANNSSGPAAANLPSQLHLG
ncbi:hypothetical protein BR93DRAFT_925448 [Coniochaeta sp. PMI_546]|nr:hypothetical protein BR93DRAFT_925448 [Coniochaeta sp. PMI_546]